MINRMAKKEPAATIAVEPIAKTISSNVRLVQNAPRGGPSIGPGGMMMLGPPDRLLASWD